MMGVCLKFFIVKKEGSKVVRIEKVGIEEDVDIVIRRRFYICKFCISFKWIIVVIEYGREIEKWFLVVFLSYYFEGVL